MNHFGVPTPRDNSNGPNNNNIPPPGFRGGRGGGGGRRGGRGGGGHGNHGGPMRNMNRYGHGDVNGHGNANGNAPPPPPPPNRQFDMRGPHSNNSNNNWRGNHGGRNGNNFRQNSFSRQNSRGGGGGGGGGRGNMRGRGRGGEGYGRGPGPGPGHQGRGNFHQQQQPFHQGPPGGQGHGHGQGQFPPPRHQQQGFIPPPPPNSNFGQPMQHQQQHPSNHMMRSGPPPPPPPPNFQQNMQQMHHPPGGIPPPPPQQQHNMRHANGQQPQWQNNVSSPSPPHFPTQQQQQYMPQNPHHQSPFSQQQIPIQQQFPVGQGGPPGQHHQPQGHVQQLATMPVMNSNQNQYQKQPSHVQVQQQHQPGSTPQIPYAQQQQQQQSFQMGQQSSTPSNATQSLDPEKVAANWTAHKSPTGVDYFYNSVTQKSTYDKPPCLSQGGSNSTAAASSNVTSKERGWTQHTDKGSGKVYYYNGVTTTWDKPPDFVDSSAKSSSPTHPQKKRKKGENDKPTTASLYNSKAEAIAAFKGLLLAKDITPTMKWNDVIKICSSDNRWNACSSVGERKQALAEYQTKRASELREQKRKEKVRAKEAFMALLTDTLPSVRAFNPSANTRFEDIRESLITDNRFHAVEDEETRHELYFDFVEELRKREERQRRGRKREAKDNFLAFLKSREEIGSLTFASTWAAFLLTLNVKDKEDSRFVVSAAMSDSDRQLYFADYVIELNAAEEEKKRRILDARRRAEKAQRNAYRDCLRTMAKEGKILPSSRWRNCEEVLSAHESFGPVNVQDKNAPRDMFEDFVYDWSDDYRRDKSFINSLIETDKNAEITAETNYDSFTEALLKAAAYSPDAYSDARRVIHDEDPVSSAKLYFNEMVIRAKNGNAMMSKRRGPYGRRAEDSSEDEGEIVEEDGEVNEKTTVKTDSKGDESAEKAASKPDSNKDDTK